MKHKHIKLIHAWIDGAEIESKGPIDIYPDADWEYDKYPFWFDDFEYRIKPEPMRELSDEEIMIIHDATNTNNWVIDFARAIIKASQGNK